MHAVVRTYSGPGAKELFDVIEANLEEIKPLIHAVQGFVSYTLVRTETGGFAVTVCQDRSGVDESLRLAREWIMKNAAHTGAAAPLVAEGTVILS